MRKQQFLILITFILYTSFEVQGMWFYFRTNSFIPESTYGRDDTVKGKSYIDISTGPKEFSTKSGRLQPIIKESNKEIYLALISLLILTSLLLLHQNYLRKNENKKLERTNEIRSRLFAILIHDLRQPIAALISYLQLRTEEPYIMTRDEAVFFEQKTIHSAKNLLNNMEELLFWCKNQMHTFAPEYRPVPIFKLFNDTKSFFEYEEKVQILFKTPPDLQLNTDEDYVKTIMRNLTSNAIAALKDTNAPKIVWSAWEDNSYIFLAINNNGPRISQDKINILYRKDHQENIKKGLGFLIVRDLAKTIHCKLEIETGDTKGTTFFLIFKC